MNYKYIYCPISVVDCLFPYVYKTFVISALNEWIHYF